MRKIILVVEDEVLVRLDISDFLRERGFEVIEASSAQEAMDLLGRNPAISLVFTDIQMPGPLNGIDLARHIRRNYPKIKTLITSGHLRASDLPPDLGRLIDKPYLPKAILGLVEEALA